MALHLRDRADEGLVDLDDQPHYAVSGLERLAPFLMSVVSDGDRWMFVSSTGALTAGRGDASGALFPYETDDRLHAAAGSVGPVTRIRVESDGEPVIWRPFAGVGRAPVRRRLAKTLVGHSVVFEEHHEALGLTLRSRWDTTERHGFVRTATLVNDGDAPVRLEVLDGLLGVLPYGIDPVVHQRFSNLTNAYKRNELVGGEGRLAVFSLESPVSDRAEPAEVLRATVVWSHGLGNAEVLLDGAAVGAFDRDESHVALPLVTGRSGAYLLRATVVVDGGASATWRIVADVAQDQAAVVALRRSLGSPAPPHLELEGEIRATGERLERIMAGADAAQCTGDPVATAHHRANVTYNVMRGGIPLGGYRIDTADLVDFVTRRNRVVAARHHAWLAGLPPTIDRHELVARAEGVGDVHLVRLVVEHLPFSFSRRHGDPSRPWNEFSIRVADDAGDPVVHFEGNWRDVFQNWEALCASFPGYLPGVVAMFVNASTADGHNPYRITRDGIDWEVPDPDDPWSNIGYWGDHQVVYLLRLLQATDRHLPGEMARRLDERWCVYADVPYRIAGYDDLVRHPKSTIRFDHDAAGRTRDRVAATGGDGRLVVGPDGDPLVVTLLEKLLVTVLAKLSNLVPGGGIWMNTQRPEWNDANNALAGHGLSMVTLFHLRQFLVHLRALVGSTGGDADVSAEVATWLADVTTVLVDTAPEVADDQAAAHRRTMMDSLGQAASRYRSTIYRLGFSGDRVAVTRSAVVELCDAAVVHLDASIRGSRRPDGLVHSYNVLELESDGTTATVRHLPGMLEGQVAALGSGVLDPVAQADLVEALAASDLYRPDQDTFLLAPVRVLPSFLDKNVIPADDVVGDPLLSALVAAGEPSVVRRDPDGRFRFHPDLSDEVALVAALDRLADTAEWADIVGSHRHTVTATYERVFDHRAYLGRSGSMYAYEGIGSVYWHMVAKLLLALQEATVAAVDLGTAPEVVDRLRAAYWRVRAGLGVNKSPEEFGAIPTDPYSHTPAHAGAQQPGMTGAVKEELLTRSLELGVRACDGEVVFDAVLLRRSELLDAPQRWSVPIPDGGRVEVELAPGTLGLTVCQVPVVVGLASGEPHVEVELADGSRLRRTGTRLGRDLSAMVFGRTGEVVRIRAALADRA